MAQKKTLNKIAIGSGLGGFLVGLVLGVVLYAFVFSAYVPSQSGAGINNQITVSGGAGRLDGTIYFSSGSQYSPDYVSTSSHISNGEYSVLLVGNRTYGVEIIGGNVESMTYTLYVPVGATTFRHDF